MHKMTSVALFRPLASGGQSRMKLGPQLLTHCPFSAHNTALSFGPNGVTSGSQGAMGQDPSSVSSALQVTMSYFLGSMPAHFYLQGFPATQHGLYYFPSWVGIFFHRRDLCPRSSRTITEQGKDGSRSSQKHGLFSVSYTSFMQTSTMGGWPGQFQV
jgi:hypothetical protein